MASLRPEEAAVLAFLEKRLEERDDGLALARAS
jgi:hypothetical protein